MRFRYFKTGICFLLITFFILTVLWPSAGGGKTHSSAALLLERANSCRNSLYRSPKRMKYRYNWEKCIRMYEKVYKRYPKSNEAAWAIFHSAGMYVKLHGYSGLEADIDKALALYNKITQDYSSSRLADDAQYDMGNIYYKYKKDMARAYVEYLKVDIKFPSGDMRPKAKKMMDKLSAILGKNNKKSILEKDHSSAGTKFSMVKEIRHWSTPTYTRVVIDLDRPVEYYSHLLKKDPDLKKPRRLYIDLEKTRVGSNIDTSIPIKDGLLRRVRAAQYKPDTVRVVLDIENISNYQIFRLHDPFRIVVDVRGAQDNHMKRKTRRAGNGIRITVAPDKNVSLARQLGLSVKRIVIDPGHGGKDPGCIFPGGIKEKDLTLEIAKMLKIKMEKELGCKVFLTRTRDVFVPLDERTAFANVKKADLFISIHVNANRHSNVYGLTTYYLNMTTDKSAIMVAARENATSEKNISDLQSILNDLMLNTKISESSKLAYQVQDGIMYDMKKMYRRHDRSLGVKQAPFYVLIGAEMPAILIETGFITNSTDRKRLLSSKYKNMLVDGIIRGVKNYVDGIDQTYMGG